MNECLTLLSLFFFFNHRHLAYFAKSLRIILLKIFVNKLFSYIVSFETGPIGVCYSSKLFVFFENTCG